ncbi:MAG: hypothetical protein ACI4EX_05920 [Lachnospiraceae bacterium]
MNNRKRYKFIVAGIAALVMTLVVPIMAYASCETHVIKDDIPNNWQYIRNVTSYNGGSHSYATAVDANGNVLSWGSCHVTIYVDEYGLGCRNCGDILKRKNVTRQVHSVSH